MLEPIVNYLQTIGSIYIEAKLNKELPDVLQKKPEPPYEGSYTRYKSYSIHLQRGQIALTHPTLVFLSDAWYQQNEKVLGLAIYYSCRNK